VIHWMLSRLGCELAFVGVKSGGTEQIKEWLRSGCLSRSEAIGILFLEELLYVVALLSLGQNWPLFTNTLSLVC
jgi:hypothetical protein